jgi:hypothetical protein
MQCPVEGFAAALSICEQMRMKLLLPVLLAPQTSRLMGVVMGRMSSLGLKVQRCAAAAGGGGAAAAAAAATSGLFNCRWASGLLKRFQRAPCCWKALLLQNLQRKAFSEGGRVGAAAAAAQMLQSISLLLW